MYQRIGNVPDSITARLAELVPEIEFKDGSGYRLIPVEGSEADSINAVVSELVGEPVANPKFIAIRAGGTIHMHGDHNGTDSTGHRYHIVLRTNPYCFGYHDGDVSRLELGSAYLMDERKEHASVNWGKETRIHLVCDGRGNE